MVVNQSWFDRDKYLSYSKLARQSKADINKINLMLEDIIRNNSHSEFCFDDVVELSKKISSDITYLSNLISK